jgi:glycosyltransferase involved in cell wall biosynthesis
VAKIGVVAIGRNEGERLRRCLESIGSQAEAIVYVDSGSTDNSLALARSLGVETVELDMTAPFSAARARNQGFQRLIEIRPEIEFVQFVDGDCEIVAGWLDRARSELEARPDTAVVCGRRRERFPDASLYNRLCDMEWDTPVGEAEACGGDALMRAQCVREVGGYRASLIAGEEPELCLRLRAAGWKVVRLDADMTRHDAAMTRFGQWWKRAVRAGHAFAEVSWLHRSDRLRLWVRETRSNWFWGLILPATALAFAWWTRGLSCLLLLGYPLLALRVYRGQRRRGRSTRDAAVYALFCVLGKFAHMYGQAWYHYHRLLSRPSVLIEYKAAATPPPEKAS